MKKFWKKTEGFTLVELIVVIAILGILAGVGTVGYSGYIKKANMAADEILLDSLNTAFAAACIENGESHTGVTASDITIGDDKTVAKSDIDVTDPSAKATSIQDAFEKYYEGGEFKVMTALNYNQSKGMFEDAGTRVELRYTDANGITYNVSISATDAAKLNASTFMTNSNLGGTGLTQKLGEVSAFAALFVGNGESNAFNTVLNSTAYQDAFKSYLGVESDDEFFEKIAELDAAGVDIATLKANGTILFAAQNAGQMSADDINAMFASGAKETILNNLNNNDASTAMSQAALAYGMYTSYAYYKNDSALIEKTKNPIDIMNGLDDAGFQEYMTTKQGQTDLEGYLAGMNMITDGASDTNVALDILKNGFATEQLADMVNTATGN